MPESLHSCSNQIRGVLVSMTAWVNLRLRALFPPFPAVVDLLHLIIDLALLQLRNAIPYSQLCHYLLF
jgi:hypothetical protein